jgi:hypothetical protein
MTITMAAFGAALRVGWLLGLDERYRRMETLCVTLAVWSQPIGIILTFV